MVWDAFDHLRSPTIATGAATTLFLALAALTVHQSGYWLTSSDFLERTIEVNPQAGFAYNNRGDAELANGDLTAALADYRACVEHDPTRVKAYINLAEVYTWCWNQPRRPNARSPRR